MAEARYWREIPRRFRFEGARCQKCDKVHFPPRLICAECGAQEFKPYTLPSEGKVATFTIIRVPPAPYKDQAPYAVGVVELNDGTKLTSMLSDCDFDKLAIGTKVRAEFRKIQEAGQAGVLQYGYKFVPA